MAKLLFSDVDGTLINSQLNVTPLTRDAIRKQIIRGNVFVPVSGRMPQAIMTAAGQIVQKCPLIAYNGALVLDELGQPVSSKFMTSDQVVPICMYIEQQHVSAWNVYSGYDWYYSPGNGAALVKQEEEIVKVTAKPSSIADLKKLPGIHKVLIMGESKVLDRQQQELSALYPELFLVKSASNLLEIVPQGVSKGQGVRQLADYFNVSLTDCWAFGDHYNDEAMLEVVGHPVLMGNAPASLKQKFTQVTLDNDHDGIAAVLEQLT